MMLFNLSLHKHAKTIHPSDIMKFMRQFATLIAAGISPVRSCDIILSNHHGTLLPSLLHQLKHDILNGKNLFTAFSRHPVYFNALVCQLIRIGEETGKLAGSLQRAADYLESQHAFKKQIQRSLFYPMITFTIAIIITLSMLIFVIPRFAELFTTSTITLPLWSRIIFRLSSVLRHYTLLITVSVAVISLSIFYLVPATYLRQKCVAISQHIPILKSLKQQTALAQFIRQLTITYSAGIPISQAIHLSSAEDTRFLILKTAIQSGMPLSKAMQQHTLFPVFVTQMMRVGEESGKLDSMLNHVADHLETELRHRISQLSQVFEPLIMITLGVVIGGLVIGMYLPIFKLGDAL